MEKGKNEKNLVSILLIALVSFGIACLLAWLITWIVGVWHPIGGLNPPLFLRRDIMDAFDIEYNEYYSEYIKRYYEWSNKSLFDLSSLVYDVEMQSMLICVLGGFSIFGLLLGAAILHSKNVESKTAKLLTLLSLTVLSAASFAYISTPLRMIVDIFYGEYKLHSSPIGDYAPWLVSLAAPYNLGFSLAVAIVSLVTAIKGFKHYAKGEPIFEKKTAKRTAVFFLVAWFFCNIISSRTSIIASLFEGDIGFDYYTNALGTGSIDYLYGWSLASNYLYAIVLPITSLFIVLTYLRESGQQVPAKSLSMLIVCIASLIIIGSFNVTAVFSMVAMILIVSAIKGLLNGKSPTAKFIVAIIFADCFLPNTKANTLEKIVSKGVLCTADVASAVIAGLLLLATFVGVIILYNKKFAPDELNANANQTNDEQLQANASEPMTINESEQAESSEKVVS